MKQVVIAGAGFAGLRLARKLGQHKDLAVTLINNGPDFRYSPALYRAATGFKLGTARIPLEWALLDTNNTSLVVGNLTHIDKDRKLMVLDSGQSLHYDFGVIAIGAVTTYFGIKGLQNHSHGVKTSEEVLALKKHIHEKLTDTSAKEHNYVIVGAGATGIELCGALGSYIKRINKKHRIHTGHVSIYLVEAGPRIMAQMSERASRKITKRLHKLGIKIECNTVVKAETNNTLQTSNGPIRTHNVIWTAGTTNNPFFKENSAHFKLDKRGKVEVDSHLQAWDSLYVCGDNASTRYSGMAITAVNHANFIAKDIVRRMRHVSRPSSYESAPVQVVPAGEKWAVLQYKNVVLSGRAVSYIRKAADFVGYAEVLGPLKALTIWSNSDRIEEESCAHCR